MTSGGRPHGYGHNKMAPKMATDKAEGKLTTGIWRQTPQLAHGYIFYRLFECTCVCPFHLVFILFYVHFSVLNLLLFLNNGNLLIIF